ncbi:response regulator transcription factor [Nonomuraea sp. NPDC050643]|uniref:response regulator transcription factor n=1 Tax=Nonomuraea sp. NPDC050643 TaxID=3155660 RepID=UPI0033EC7C8F
MEPTVRSRAGANAEVKLLVVDDEPIVRELLSASLRFAGFTVATAAKGSEALDAALREQPDLVVLDVMLPDMDGFEVVRRLRERTRPAGGSGYVPILFLTARDGTADKIDGLRVGGDDYVTKPFSLEELIARIQAILRRTGGGPDGPTIRVGDLALDTDSRQVARGGRPLQLSPTEFKLLHYLMDNADRVVSKIQILDHVWQYDFNGDISIVESYISYLRRKVDIAEPKLIHTVRGVGYVLRSPHAAPRT